MSIAGADTACVSMNPQSAHGNLLLARLEYVRTHGARLLFNNQPPPAPGWPRLRKGKVIYLDQP